MNRHKSSTRFVHHRLHAYRLALELFERVEQLAAEFPKGHADLKDQLRRATAATVRNIAEGANRIHPRDKAARFMIARAECGESEAAIQMAQIVGIIAPHTAAALRQRADRVAAMLLGLIRRQQRRAEAGP